ncbi:RTA-like protein [Aspergillus oryzae]|uniref:RTA-like protein n=1 Tax=Aspergillus oryzae TaxID=5062 RepID=A0A1S9D7E2_ASPOZ|nr:RTA-like protein [Aspergillus oryzae]
MSGGILLEIIGYGGRLMLHSNPFNFSAFLQYLICLTIGPAFITAAIYICFARVIVVYGASMSRIRPKTYARIFITCDLICLVLQAAGGAITATAGQEQDGLRHTGINIMIAGLASQVVALGSFMILCGDYVWRLKRHVRVVPQPVDGDWKWKGFLIGLAIATLTIFIRSIFRVAELNGGFSSDLANDEVAFMILEGAMMVIALCQVLPCYADWLHRIQLPEWGKSMVMLDAKNIVAEGRVKEGNESASHQSQRNGTEITHQIPDWLPHLQVRTSPLLKPSHVDADMIEGLAESDVTSPGQPVSGAPPQGVAATGLRKLRRL